MGIDGGLSGNVLRDYIVFQKAIVDLQQLAAAEKNMEIARYLSGHLDYCSWISSHDLSNPLD